MTIVSGAAVFDELAGREGSFAPMTPPWPGTIDAVTINPDKMGTFAVARTALAEHPAG